MNKVTSNILVINCGSSSLKYEVFNIDNKSSKEKSLCKGTIERIGNDDAKISHTVFLYQESDKDVKNISIKKIEQTKCIKNHVDAFYIMISLLTSAKHGVIPDVKDVDIVGHRVVHGGEKYSQSVIIDKNVEKAIEDLIPLAPLHNSANLSGIKAAQKIFPNCLQVAVFDTAFHQTMPDEAFMYALPYEVYKKYGIRRYGFHGISHQYVSQKAAQLLGKNKNDIDLITCHLGNGCSVTAIEKGRSVETSMGFTPLQGMMMGTRSGSIDPAILTTLKSMGMNEEELDTMMNKKSGLLGISGISNDMRDLHDAAHKGNNRAELALKMFARSAQKFIGAYTAVLHNVDMLIFTAGVGQNDPQMRERICEPLRNLGMMIDTGNNISVGKSEGIISAQFSPVPIGVIETQEELQIARDAFNLIMSRSA